MSLSVGSPAPDFTLPDQHLRPVRLAGLLGSPVLLVFYPFSFTPVCGRELADLQQRLPDLQEQGVTVLAVSCDAPATQRVFADREGLQFPLLSDFWPHGQTAQAYGVLDAATGAPRRGTFLVDPGGMVRWAVVNEPAQARSVDDYLGALQDL